MPGEYKRMQQMSNIAWFRSLCLLSTMPFANCSIDSDISVNQMADLSHQTMVSTNTTIPDNGSFCNVSQLQNLIQKRLLLIAEALHCFLTFLKLSKNV
jgi:hypothetical protein